MELNFRSHALAACSEGLVRACVTAVASELTDLERVVTGLSAREVALIAHGAVEAAELDARMTELILGEEPPCGDWALCVLAGLREDLASLERQRKQRGSSDALLTLKGRAIERAAASEDRSPVIYYGELLSEAAQGLARRKDPRCWQRQLEALAEELHSAPANALLALRDLAMLEVGLGREEEGLLKMAEVLRQDPLDVWTYNHLALRLPWLGFGSLGRRAAQRGLEVIERVGDSERLASQLGELEREAGARGDRAGPPSAAVEQLTAALAADLKRAPGPVDVPALAHRLVPELATARVKALPPMPGAAALSALAQRARALPRVATVPSAAFLPPLPAPLPKVGRNEPCPCGSGKKYKSCCMA